MKIYKHKSKEKYCFIQDKHYNVEYFKLEKNNPVFESECLYEDKDLLKFEKKIAKKGFLPFELTETVNKQVNALMEQFELGKFYYFLEENETNILKSNIIGLRIAKAEEQGRYYLHRISTEIENSQNEKILTDLKTFFGGSIYSEKDEFDAPALEYLLPFYLKLVLTMGYVPKTLKELFSYNLEKPITPETEFPGNYYKNKYAADLYRVGYNNKLKRLQFINYGLKDNLLISKHEGYKIINKKKDLKVFMDDFNDQEVFEAPISEEEFKTTYRESFEPEFYEKEEKVDVDLLKFPLEVPFQTLEIENLLDTILEQSKYYFFANTAASNPKEWMLSYICIVDLNKGWFIYSKPFLMNDLNKALSNPIDITLEYSYEKESFIQSQKRAFKKHQLKPIATIEVFENYTGQTLTDLQNEALQNSFVYQDKYDKVIDVYKHYACVRDNSCNYLHWQFFTDETEQSQWLKSFENKSDKLYISDRNCILEYTESYLKYRNWYQLKRDYLNNPEIKSAFWGSHQYREFSKYPIYTQDQIKKQDDFVFSVPKEEDIKGQIIIIKGDVEIDGSLIFKKDREVYIIIEGNVKAKNLIIVDAPQLIYIQGKLEIENIIVDNSRLKCKDAKTKILMHDSSNPLDLKTTIKYEHEVSFYSKNLLDGTLVDKERNSFVQWDTEKILTLLQENKPFLAEVFDESAPDLTAHYQREFEQRMLDWGYFYPEYAGCETLAVYNDSEIKNKVIYPDSGDWVVHDIRGKSGTYGISHEDFSIYSIQIKKPKKYDVNYKEKPLELLVNAEELMTRYQSVCMLYTSWEHRTSPSFAFENHEETTETYEKEKVVFADDPHLALYWLNHFGATLDPRFDEVVEIVNQYNLIEQLPILNEPLAFFQNTTEEYNLDIEKNTDIFRLRRAYLVFNEHSYKNYNPDNVKLWLASITVYPKMEEQLIVRMRWLKNNLFKCGNWDDFEAILKPEHKNIPLMAYVLAFNPNLSDSDKTKHAHQLIEELLTYKKYFKEAHKKSFAEVYLWDIREFVTDKVLLKKAVDHFFKGNTTDKLYIDLQVVLGVETSQINTVKEGLDALNTLYENYDKRKVSDKEIEEYKKQLANILLKYDDETVQEILANVRNNDMAKHAFVWAWDSNLSTKEAIITKLFIDLELSTYEINAEFYSNFPAFLVNENTDNFELIKTLMHLPESAFRNNSAWEKSKKTATMFLLDHVHITKVYYFLLATLNEKPTEENIHLKEAIHTNLLTTEYESKINSSLKLSKSNIESVLDVICQSFLDYGYNAEAYRTIYYCVNPLAKDWIQNKMKDEKWIMKFARIATHYDPLSEELKDAFVSALEFIEEEEKGGK